MDKLLKVIRLFCRYQPELSSTSHFLQNKKAILEYTTELKSFEMKKH